MLFFADEGLDKFLAARGLMAVHGLDTVGTVPGEGWLLYGGGAKITFTFGEHEDQETALIRAGIEHGLIVSMK